MTSTDLSAAMTAFADDAQQPPIDLLERVETRHRRRRRVQAAVATCAAVAVVAAGAGLLRPAVETAQPAGPPTTAGFHLPPVPATVPSIKQAWPDAVVADAIANTPADRPPLVVGVLDPTHWLVVSQPDSGKMWSYAVADRKYRPLLTHTGGAVFQENLAVTGKAIVRAVAAGDHTEVWMSRRDGGNDHRVGTVNQEDPNSLWADDTNVYLSFNATLGIFRMSLNDGRGEALDGFDQFRLDKSPWAFSDAGPLRHLVTGQEIAVARSTGAGPTAPAGAQPSSAPSGEEIVECTPAFCVAQRDAAKFVQRPDGSERTPVPYPGVESIMPGHLLVSDEKILVDPLTGVMGQAGPGCRYEGYIAMSGGVIVNWRCKGSLSRIFLRTEN
jgi:hypothetical protein